MASADLSPRSLSLYLFIHHSTFTASPSRTSLSVPYVLPHCERSKLTARRTHGLSLRSGRGMSAVVNHDSIVPTWEKCACANNGWGARESKGRQKANDSRLRRRNHRARVLLNGAGVCGIPAGQLGWPILRLITRRIPWEATRSMGPGMGA